MKRLLYIFWAGSLIGGAWVWRYQRSLQEAAPAPVIEHKTAATDRAPVSESDRSELNRLIEENKALPALRGEYGRLKDQAASIQKEEKETQALREEKQRFGGRFPSETDRPDYLPIAKWSMRGVDTPENTVVSFLFSLKEGRKDLLMQCMDDKFSEMFAKSEGEEELQKGSEMFKQIPGIRILEKTIKPESPNEAVVVVLIATEKLPIHLRQDKGRWVVTEMNGPR